MKRGSRKDKFKSKKDFKRSPKKKVEPKKEDKVTEEK